MPDFWQPRISIHALAAAVLLGAGCGPKRVAPKVPTAPPATTLIALLPDPESGVTGHARVTNEFGSANLVTARAATQVKSDGPPGAVSAISEDEVTRLFGAALAALPPEPQHFTLYFKFQSEELTDESRRLVQDVLQEVKTRPVPDVIAIGHTDTTGVARNNVQLGLRRATAVRMLLVNAGLAAAAVQVASHGEAELLVQTADGVFEPRNRRVEITVR